MLILLGLIIVLVVSILIDSRQLKNVILFGLIIVFSIVKISNLFIPIFDKEGLINPFYMLIFNFIFPVTLLIIFIISALNTKKMMNYEGKRVSSFLFLGYGIYALLNFSIINYRPYYLYEFANGAIIIYLGFIFHYLNFSFIFYNLYAWFLSEFSKLKKPDVIIVLGSGLIGDKVPPLLQARLNQSISLKHKYIYPKILVSGGQGDDELISEAEAMKLYLLKNGINSDDILVENKSTNTYENLYFSKKIIDKYFKQSKITIVSNNFHILRSAFISKKLKMNACCVGSTTASYYYPNAFLREYIGTLWMFKTLHFFLLGLLTILLIISIVLYK